MFTVNVVPQEDWGIHQLEECLRVNLHFCRHEYTTRFEAEEALYALNPMGIAARIVEME